MTVSSERTMEAAWQPTLLERCLGWYERTLASADFRRRAVAFPLTRPLARRRARALYDLCAGFTFTQVLLACVRLDLFETLAQRGPMTAAALAESAAIEDDAAERLLRAATALRLTARRTRVGQPPRYALGDLGAAVVGEPGIAAMVEHHAMVYADLADPIALLRGERRDTSLAAFWPYADRGRDQAELSAERLGTYSQLMSVTQPMVASEVLAAYSFADHRCLLDVGGGTGAFLRAVAEATPGLALQLFDLPAVAELAHDAFARDGLSQRATTHAGDFRTDPLPSGADIVSLVRVLFDHDDASALNILRAVRAALPAGGTLLIAEPIASADASDPVSDAYFGMYLLAMGRGRTRTAAAHGDLLARAGFSEPRQAPTRMPIQAGVLTAKAI